MSQKLMVQNHTTTLRARLGRLGLIMSLVFVGLYGITRIYPIIKGPRLFVNLAHGQTVHTPLIEITGTARNAQETQINGTTITTNIDGDFITPVVLSAGANTIIVSARDNLGKQIVKSYTLILDESITPPALARTHNASTY